jgi:hypothetical protein
MGGGYNGMFSPLIHMLNTALILPFMMDVHYL